MINNFIKLGIRYIFNQKKHSLVVVLGMAFSMAAAFLIYSYVHYEKSFDSFHEQGENLYRVVVDAQAEGEDAYKSPFSFAAQGPTALAEVPEIESFTRLMSMQNIVVSSADLSKDALSFAVNDYYYSDDNFFEVFSFPLIQGNPKEALKEPGTVVISESLKTKLFGKQDPIGEKVIVDGKHNCTVTGIFHDIPQNTHLKFEMLFSLNTFPWIMNSNLAWSNHSFFTYFLLKEGTNAKLVESKIVNSYQKENRAVNQMNCVWEFQPVNEAYLNTSDFTSKPEAFRFGNSKVVYFLSMIALLILTIAWVNYINLTTAKTSDRFKEIGVRKTNGASRISLLIQFFIESAIYNISSVIVAALIILIAFKWFARLMAFSVSLLENPLFWVFVGTIIASGIVLSGLYSAFLLSKIDPFKKQKFSKNTLTKFSYRDALVVFQFVIIISLISGVLVINRQLSHINSIDLGFQKEQVLVLNIPRVEFEQNKESKLDAFRDELIKYAEIENITASTSIPGERFGSGNGGLKIAGQQSDDNYFRVGRVMPNYFDFYDINIIEGNNFNNYNNQMILNKEAVGEFGFTKADEVINKIVNWQGNEFTVVGVTESFHQESLHILPEPMIFYTKEIVNSFNYISVKVKGENIEASISKIEKEYKRLFPGNPHNYFFLDRFFDQQYKKDIAFRKLFSFFSILALIIGYFGLHGLTTYIILKRTKEIGVRKVNGAKVAEILRMLNRDYTKWVAIAFVIACPIAYYAMNKWLENFAYKTTLSWWIFALAGALALSIALLTVSWQSWRAATRNPIEALRYE